MPGGRCGHAHRGIGDEAGEAVSESIRGKTSSGERRGTESLRMHLPRKAELVGQMRDDRLRDSGASCGCRRPCATMMDGGRYLREEAPVRDGADDVDVFSEGVVVDARPSR